MESKGSHPRRVEINTSQLIDWDILKKCLDILLHKATAEEVD